MTQATALPRTLLIYGLSLVLAVVLGFLLATPKDFSSFVLVAMLFFALATPLLMRWHHLALVATLNASLLIYLLPGQPHLWMLMAGISLAFALLRRTMDKESNFLHVPTVAWSLIFLTLVILVTAHFTGGIGFRALGSNVYGGKYYYTTLAAVVVYFALVSQRIPLHHAPLYMGLFFLSEITAVFSNIAYVLGPSFWWLFAIFPSELAVHQARADFVMGQSIFARITGLSWAGHALFCFMLARYGVRGIFDFTRPGRLLAFLLVVALTMLGGFRTYVVLFAIVLAILFRIERLYRTKTFAILLGLTVMGAILVLPNVTKLPLSVQRSLSILPFIQVSPVAKWDAQASSEWRLSMWRLLIPQIPDHLWLGKGYALDPTEMYLAEESVRRGLSQTYEYAALSGNYHSGPLSIILPFGIWGIIGVVWLWIAGLKVLYNNLRYGPPELRNINVFILAYFMARIVFFCFFFGALNTDLVVMTGLLGMSISLNGGVCRRPETV
jgi:hypothetical protein